jgi:hypothetical protein
MGSEWSRRAPRLQLRPRRLRRADLIVADVDTKESGRDRRVGALVRSSAVEWGLPVSGHAARPVRPRRLARPVFRVPADLDPATLRQPDAVKEHINLRCIGYDSRRRQRTGTTPAPAKA